MRVLSSTIQTARKHYPCDACHTFLQSNYGRDDVSAEDWLVIEGAQADRWKITPGSKYRKMVLKDGDDILTVRHRLDVESVCERHDLFAECYHGLRMHGLRGNQFEKRYIFPDRRCP